MSNAGNPRTIAQPARSWNGAPSSTTSYQRECRRCTCFVTEVFEVSGSCTLKVLSIKVLVWSVIKHPGCQATIYVVNIETLLCKFAAYGAHRRYRCWVMNKSNHSLN